MGFNVNSVEYKVTRPVRQAVVDSVDRNIVRADRTSNVDTFVRHDIESVLYFALHRIRMQMVTYFKETI